MNFTIQDCEAKLRQGLQGMSLSISDDQVSQLLAYLQEFHKWNQAYNLSAIRDPEAMVTLHLLDSLALLPHLQAFIKHHPGPLGLVDVGTGGGLPGFVLAIVCPELAVTLLDSNGKKTRFLFQTAHKLGLKNIKVENNRVEKFSPDDKFAIVTSRAFASLEDMVKGSAHLLADNGEFWAMKGVYPEAELGACKGVEQVASHLLSIPGSEAERHLIRLLKK